MFTRIRQMFRRVFKTTARTTDSELQPMLAELGYADNLKDICYVAIERWYETRNDFRRRQPTCAEVEILSCGKPGHTGECEIGKGQSIEKKKIPLHLLRELERKYDLEYEWENGYTLGDWYGYEWAVVGRR